VADVIDVTSRARPKIAIQAEQQVLEVRTASGSWLKNCENLQNQENTVAMME
jgi:hypothetical protein